MAEIVNLRRLRKAKARTAKAADAERNRAHFGRTSAEREASGTAVERSDAILDGHRREPSRSRNDEAGDG